jgi:DNA ligase-1
MLLKSRIYYLIFSLFLTTTLYAQKPHLLLLKTYKDQNISGWMMSEKLDGIRAYWNGRELLFRSGKKINAPKYFTKDYPSFEIDGELWSKRGDFEFISSVVRDKVPGDGWKKIKHYIFEVPNTKGGLLQRLKKLEKIKSNFIKIIPQRTIKSKKELSLFLKNIEKNGGEGVVVRDPDAPYIAKRTSKVLKVKTFHDMECIVVGYTQGKGKYSGMVGALKCKLEDGTLFKIGSGLTVKERKNPPKLKTLITFKYKEFTKYGKPRFPIFLRTRK